MCPSANSSDRGRGGRNAHAPVHVGASAERQRTERPLAASGSARPAGFTTFKHIRRNWTELFELVLDVESYPDFVPRCRDVKLLSRKNDGPGRTIIISRMTVGLAVFEVSYANRTVGDAAGRRIEVESIDGPLRYLQVVWQFEPTDDEHTKVEFSVSYEFDNLILAGLASRIFASMFGEIMNAFEQRARQVCGRKKTDTKC
jgi:coenzyme Q-binding protein COQ10